MNIKNMKKLFVVVITGVLVCFNSCKKLDLKPANTLQDEQIFTSEAGINAYLSTLYRNLPIEDFRYGPASADGLEGGETGFNPIHAWKHFYHSGAACGEMVGPWGGLSVAGGFGYWP